jgi:hypothetical protein
MHHWRWDHLPSNACRGSNDHATLGIRRTIDRLTERIGGFLGIAYNGQRDRLFQRNKLQGDGHDHAGYWNVQ